MSRSGLLGCCLTFLLATNTPASGLLGVFQGKIVKAYSLDSKTHERWVYVQSRSGSVRKVNIARALVEYDADVPAKERLKNPSQSLHMATEVRITAEQDRTNDGSGDWQAKNVLILAPKEPVKNKAVAAGLDTPVIASL